MKFEKFKNLDFKKLSYVDFKTIINSQEFNKLYSENSFFDKIKQTAQKAGISVVYCGLLLFYTLKKSSIPDWAKTTIIGSLGYFICPIDALPDFLVTIGFSDDLSILAFAIVTVAIFIDDEIRIQSKNKLKDWFGNYDENLILNVDFKIKENI